MMAAMAHHRPPPRPPRRRKRDKKQGSRGGVDGSNANLPGFSLASLGRLCPRDRTRMSRELSNVLRHRAQRMGVAIRPDGFVTLDALVPRLKTIRKLVKSKGDGTKGRERTQPVPRGAQADILKLLQMIVAKCNKQRFTLRRIRAVASSSSSSAGAAGTAAATAVSAGELLEMENNNDAGANVLSNWEIRANQGHTMEHISVEDHARIVEYLPVCIHGTYRRHVQAILKMGLNRMQRQHVHMAPGLVGDVDPISGNTIISGMRHDCDTIVRVDMARAMRTHGLEFFHSSNGVILCPGDQNGAIPPDCLTVESRDQAEGGSGSVRMGDM
jgi:RNA:NAD 2'-phosphotransferase (TPT1/KptA family)